MKFQKTCGLWKTRCSDLAKVDFPIPVEVTLASKDVDELLPGVFLVEGELHGALERVVQKPEVEEPGRGERQQVVGRRRKLIPDEK